MKKTKVFFSSTAFMFLAFFLGVTLIVVCDIYSDQFKDISVFFIVVRIIAEALVSISVLDFFINISTEKELINTLQTHICQDTDFSKIDDKSQYIIMQKVINQQLCANAGEYQTELSALAADMSKVIWNDISNNVFINEYNRSVVIILRDSEIIVRTTTLIEFCNPTGKDISFRQQPIFITEAEAKSYRILNYSYNGKIESKYTNKAPERVYDAKNYPRYKTIPAMTHCMKEKGKHTFNFETQYSTNYANFFQTDVLKYNCRNFHLSASVQDERKKKNNEWILKWQIICHPEEKYHIAPEKLMYSIPSSETAKSTNEFQTLGSIIWFPKYGGYVLTLNQLKHDK